MEKSRDHVSGVSWSRREFLRFSGLAGGAALVAACAAPVPQPVAGTETGREPAQ